MIRRESNVIRLRQGSQIVGFRKRVQNTVFYSRDFYAWSGETIPFDQHDQFSGFHDKNNKPVFAGDIIRISSQPKHYFILHFDEVLGDFLLVDFETNITSDASAVQTLSEAKSITRISTVFIN